MRVKFIISRSVLKTPLENQNNCIRLLPTNIFFRGNFFSDSDNQKSSLPPSTMLTISFVLPLFDLLIYLYTNNFDDLNVIVGVRGTYYRNKLTNERCHKQE